MSLLGQGDGEEGLPPRHPENAHYMKEWMEFRALIDVLGDNPPQYTMFPVYMEAYSRHMRNEMYDASTR